MISILVGLIFMGLGLWGLVHWFTDLVTIIRGFVPLALLLGGIVGIMAGLSSIQAHRKKDGTK